MPNLRGVSPVGRGGAGVDRSCVARADSKCGSS